MRFSIQEAYPAELVRLGSGNTHRPMNADESYLRADPAARRKGAGERQSKQG